MPIMLVMPVARGAAGGAQPTATLVRVSGPITRGQKNALTTMSTIRSPDLMLLVVVRGTVRTTVPLLVLAVLPLGLLNSYIPSGWPRIT